MANEENLNTKGIMEENQEETQDKLEKLDELLHEQNEKNKIVLNTHTLISRYFCGDIKILIDGYVEVELETVEDMIVDKMGLVHGGFIFGAADFAAMAAVNDKNVVLAAANCQFLSPVKVGDVVVFKARVRHKEGRKRNVHVKGFVENIKVFEGEFVTVITEKHILKIKLANDEQTNGNNENDDI